MKTAYPQIPSTCNLRLYSNIPFDNTYKHHSFISKLFTYNNTSLTDLDVSNLEVKESFINRTYRLPSSQGIPPIFDKYPQFDITGDYNFNFSNGLIGTLTLELTPAQTNANYLRVKCGDDYYYYFITNISQDNCDTYTLSLELDVLMTYQDEFLEGMKDVPVFTNRKHSHRYATNTSYLKCADYKLSDDVFNNVKPSIVKSSTPLEFKGEMYKLKDIKWLYICVDGDFFYNTSTTEVFKQLTHYKFKDLEYPLCICCIPLNIEDLTIGWFDINNIYVSIVLTATKRRLIFEQLIGSGKIHGCKISSYPPFIDSQMTVYQSGNNYQITIPNDHIQSFGGLPLWNNDKSQLQFDSFGEDGTQATNNRCFIICNENGTPYQYEDFYLNIPSQTRSVLEPRHPEPKLYFKPFTKYVLTASYSEGNEFFPELIYSNGYYATNKFGFETCYNFYIGDYSIFTYQTSIVDVNGRTHYANYKMNNIGLSSSMNYVIPSGTNALDVFNTTQANSFYQSKTASGITSGLAIVGGFATLGAGLVATGISAGTSTAMAVGGATAIAQGVASLTNTIKSTNAKIEDLKNTPDAVNVQGGSFVGDYSRYEPLPFITIYECSDVIKKQANDYYYSYGYQVARDCYFNTELELDNSSDETIDNNIFGRSIFNYVQLNEDITNKIDADIPLIIKQKISSIFNNGITLWTFFFSYELYNATSIPSGLCPIDNYFMKNVYDNTEYEGNQP